MTACTGVMYKCHLMLGASMFYCITALTIIHSRQCLADDSTKKM